MTPLPNGPWEKVKGDFYGPIPSGEYMLLLIDEYSRFPVIEIVKSTASNTVIPVIDKVFSNFGIPDVLTTDNGPPFNGNEIRQFAEYMGFKHRKVTPLWPKSNSQPENFNKNLKKILQTAKIEKRNWRQELYKFLRNFSCCTSRNNRSESRRTDVH